MLVRVPWQAAPTRFELTTFVPRLDRTNRATRMLGKAASTVLERYLAELIVAVAARNPDGRSGSMIERCWHQ